MYEAEGFAFETKEEAETARTEAEAIRYLKQQTKMDDPETILRLYNSLLEKQLFQTEIGLRFLFELQDYLQTIPYVKSEDIRPIPAHRQEKDKKRTGKLQKEKAREKAEAAKKAAKEKKRESTETGGRSYRAPFRVVLVIAITLAACVIGMFVITYVSGNSTNIVNYENEILNQYSSWEEELDSREQELNERELMIEEKEEELGITTGTEEE